MSLCVSLSARPVSPSSPTWQCVEDICIKSIAIDERIQWRHHRHGHPISTMIKSRPSSKTLSGNMICSSHLNVRFLSSMRTQRKDHISKIDLAQKSHDEKWGFLNGLQPQVCLFAETVDLYLLVECLLNRRQPTIPNDLHDRSSLARMPSRR